MAGTSTAKKYLLETQHLINVLCLKLEVFKELWADGLKEKSVVQILHCCHLSDSSTHFLCIELLF